MGFSYPDVSGRTVVKVWGSPKRRERISDNIPDVRELTLLSNSLFVSGVIYGKRVEYPHSSIVDDDSPARGAHTDKIVCAWEFPPAQDFTT